MRERHRTTNQDIGRIRAIGEKDLRISHEARTLLFRICSQQATENKKNPYAPFPVPWTLVRHWCGIHNQDMCRAFLWQLVAHQYLFDEGLKGCPAKHHYKLNFDVTAPVPVNGVILPTSQRLNLKKHFLKLRASLR